jgi:CHAD domain-containing protein
VSLDARARLVAALDTEHAEAHARVVEWFGGPAWADLTADLVRWVSGPPLGDAAGKRARQVARKRLRKATAKALRAADDVDLTALADLGPTAVGGEGSGPGDDDLMVRAHRLRKAGRRVAHAAKAVTHQPTHVLGSSARELGRAGKQVQSTLGDHRDAVLLARHVRRAGDAVEHDAGDRAPCDRLAGAADRRARDALDRAAAAITRLRDAART